MDFDLNVEAAHDGEHESQDNRISETVSMCTICRELLSNHRTCVTLRCGHHFHLDCIGSAFNGKKEMRCPNCRNLEQGRWSIPRDNPDPDTGADVSIVFTGFGIYSSDLIFGCDLCPFEGSGSINYNSVEELIRLDQSDNFHKPGPEGRHYCPFVEYLFTIVGPENDLNSQHIARGWDPLSPLTPIPTNPKLFQSGSQPQLIIARRYFAHPVIDPPTLDESINFLLANNQVVPSDPRDNFWGNVSIAADDQVVPSYPWNNLAANGSVHPLHLGGSVVPNAPMPNVSVVQPYQDTNLVANVPMVQSYLWDNLAANGSVQRQFHLGGNLVPNALMDNNLVGRPYQDINLVANAPLVQPYSMDNLAANGSVHWFHLGDNAPMDNDSVFQPYQDVNLVTIVRTVQRYPWNNIAANGSVHSHHLRDSLIPNAPRAYDSVVQPYHINLVANGPVVPPSPNDNVMYYAHDIMPNIPVVAWSTEHPRY